MALPPATRSTGNLAKPLQKVLSETFGAKLTNGDTVIIEAGYVTDLATIPRRALLAGSFFLWLLAIYYTAENSNFWATLSAMAATGLTLGVFVSGRAEIDEEAFILHDYLYEFKDQHSYSRKFVDKQMISDMIRLRPEAWGRHLIIYSVVRLLGWLYWYDIVELCKSTTK